jgi:hypothetical protein
MGILVCPFGKALGSGIPLEALFSLLAYKGLRQLLQASVMLRHILLTTVIAAAAAAAEPTSLFNGTDLTGWDGNMDLWSVKDGCITGTTTADPADPKKSVLKHNTFLVYRAGTVKDFELTLQYKMVGGNSGIQYRSKELDKGEQGPVISGYQADFEAGPKYSGILYEEKARGILALRGEKVTITDGADPKKPNIAKDGTVGVSEEIQAAIKSEDWNSYRIVAKGGHLQHFINDRQTVDVTDNSTVGAKEGLLALQIHVGGPMVVQFKDIKLTELK